MRLRSPPAIALLSVLLAGMSNAYASALNQATNKQEQDDPTKFMAETVQDARSLAVSSGVQTCGTRDPSNAEARAFFETVEAFYQEMNGSPGGQRRLQQIPIGVNFVAVRSTAQEGATLKQVQDQMKVLSDAYSPTFSFVMKTLKEVTNDNYYNNVVDGGEVEKQMKGEYHAGGMETLNVYCVKQNTKSWATFPGEKAGVMDGVVLSDAALPNDFGGGGDVSTVDLLRTSGSSLLALICSFLAGWVRPLCTRLDIGWDFFIHSPTDANLPVIGSQTRRLRKILVSGVAPLILARKIQETIHWTTTCRTAYAGPNLRLANSRRCRGLGSRIEHRQPLSHHLQ
jgi:hypothetical protein